MKESRDWGTRWNKHTNLPETLWLPVFSSASGGQKEKDVWNHATFQKEKNKTKTSTELLLGIYLTKLNEEERRRRKHRASPIPDLGRGKRPHTPLSLPPFPSCCRGRVWAWPSVTLIGHIWIFLTVFWPPPPIHPPTTPPFLSHGAVVSTDQAFSHDWGQFVVICIWDWTQKKKE